MLNVGVSLCACVRRAQTLMEKLTKRRNEARGRAPDSKAFRGLLPPLNAGSATDDASQPQSSVLGSVLGSLQPTPRPTDGPATPAASTPRIEAGAEILQLG